MFTVNTETGEIACVLLLKIPNVYPPVGATHSRGRFVSSRRTTRLRCSTVPWMRWGASRCWSRGRRV